MDRLAESSPQKSFDYLACAVHKQGRPRCSLSPLGTSLAGQVISLLSLSLKDEEIQMQCKEGHMYGKKE